MITKTVKRLKQNNSRLYGIILIAVLGGFLFGYDTAVISGTVESLNKVFVIPLQLEEKLSNLLLGFIVSSALIGCVIGSSTGGLLSHKMGRKKALLLSSLLFIFSSIGSAWPEISYVGFGKGDHTALISFIMFRIVGGLGIGIASMLSPMYIAEISPSLIRGRLVSWNQMAIVTGILAVYFVNFLIAGQGGENWLHHIGWRWMFASEFIPASLFFCLLWTVPESPRWLAISGKKEKALNVLSILYGETKAKIELNSINETLREHSGRLFSFGVKIILIGILLSAFQQLVGIQVIIYYTPEIFKNMGYGINSSMFQTVLVGAINMVFTILAIYTVDKWGRKPLLLAGSALMAISMYILGYSLYLQKFGIVSIVAVLGFVMSFSFSWGPVVWVLLSEMFPNVIRSKAMAVAVTVQWIMNYTVSSSFPFFDRNAWFVEKFNHSFSFWLFGTMALLALIFVWRMVPETKGKSLEEMEKIWN